MGRILKNEFYRAFVNKRFFFVIFIEICIVAAHVFVKVIPIATQTVPFFLAKPDRVGYVPGAYRTWLASLNGGYIHLLTMALLPLLIAVPYGDSLYMDEQSRYLYHINTRTGKSRYYLSKILALFLSGGTVAAFPYLLSFLVNIAILPMETVIPSTFSGLGNIVCLSGLYYKSPFLYVIAFLVLTLIGFGILNCLCFIATYILSSRFLVTLFPFTVDYLMFVIGDFFNVGGYTPWTYLNIDGFWKPYIPAAVIQFSIFVVLIIITYLYKCSRKADSL